jgi:hypothetical protein
MIRGLAGTLCVLGLVWLVGGLYGAWRFGSTVPDLPSGLKDWQASAVTEIRSSHIQCAIVSLVGGITASAVCFSLAWILCAVQDRGDAASQEQFDRAWKAGWKARDDKIGAAAQRREPTPPPPASVNSDPVAQALDGMAKKQ